MSVEFLLHRGADASMKNDEGATPADLAKAKGSLDLARTIESFVPGEVDEPTPKGAAAARATDLREEEVD